MELPEQERQEMAYWLLDRLPEGCEPEGADDDVLQESIRLAEERSAELDSGKVKALTYEEFRAGLEKERATWR